MIKKTIIPYSLLFMYVVLAMSRIQTAAKPYGVFNIIDIRNSIGLTDFEIIIFAFIFFMFLLYRKVKPDDKPLKKLFNYFLIASIIGLLSSLLLSDSRMIALRALLAYLRPMIIFLLIAYIPWDEKELRSFFKVFCVLFIINLAVSYYQFIGLEYVIDDLSGLMDDSVTFVALMYTGVIYCFVNYLVTKKKINFLFIILILIPTLISSTDKITILMIPTLSIIYIVYKGFRVRYIIKYSIYFILLIFVFVNVFILFPPTFATDIIGGLSRIDIKYLSLGEIINQIQIFKGYTNIPIIYKDYPYSMLVGVGPAMYGSFELLGKFMSNYGQLSSLTPLTSMAFGHAITFGSVGLFGTGFTSVASSDVVVLLVEFGIIFSVFYFLFWKRLIEFCLIFRDENIQVYVRVLLLSLFGYLVFLFMFSFITFYDGIVRTSNVIPYFILLGMLYRVLEKYRKVDSIGN